MGYKQIRKEAMRDSWIYRDVRCDRCNKELNPQYPGILDSEGDWLSLQPRHALFVTLGGYYGGFFDCDKDPVVLLCKECANLLVTEWPIFQKAIDSTP